MWLDSKAVNCPQKWGNFNYRQGMPMAGVLEVHMPTTEIRSPRSRTLAPIPWGGL